MVLDTLSNIDQYKVLHPLFPQAIDYITSRAWQNASPGTYTIVEGQIKAIVIEAKGLTPEEAAAGFECHDQGIDIQVCINGPETMGWKSRADCQHAKAPYNEQKDVTFYNDKPDTFFTLTNEQFAIFFPGDVHAPLINEDGAMIRKLVMKVRV